MVPHLLDAHKPLLHIRGHALHRTPATYGVSTRPQSCLKHGMMSILLWNIKATFICVRAALLMLTIDLSIETHFNVQLFPLHNHIMKNDVEISFCI